MVPDLRDLHGPRRTPSLKGKQNSGLALRDRRPLWPPASAGRAHFDPRGQLAVPRRRLRAGAVTRSLGPSLPPPLVERLAQRDPAARLGVALPFVTVDGAGYPHPMLLSYLEVRAYDARTVGLVIGVESRSARSEEHTSELQSRPHLVCRLLLE